MKNFNICDSISGAVFSDDRRHRYALWRIWDRSKPILIFTGLNASTANDIKNDPTVIRMIGFAKAWGFGGLIMVNLYPLVSPYPEDLLRWLKSSDCGQAAAVNDSVIKRARLMSAKAMVGWGNEGRRLGTRPDEVIHLLGEPVYCLRVTLSGEPTHPLYQPLSSQLMPYIRRKG